MGRREGCEPVQLRVLEQGGGRREGCEAVQRRVLEQSGGRREGCEASIFCKRNVRSEVRTRDLDNVNCDVGERAWVPVMMIHKGSVTQVSVLGQTQTKFVGRSLLLLMCGLLEGARDD